MGYTVTFKKVLTGIEQDDENEALDEASHILSCGMASHTGLEDYFETEVKKEPVKETTITEDGIRQFLKDNYDGEGLTEKQVKDFIDFLELDVADWLKENMRCFLKEE